MRKHRSRQFLFATLFAAIAIALSLFLLARRDIAARYAGGAFPERPQFDCLEFHTRDPLGNSRWRITLNFSREQGGEPVQWHLWPFREIHEEELLYGQRRYCFPPR